MSELSRLLFLMKHLFIIILILTLPFQSFSQMIDEMELHNFKVAFSETYIQNNHIKSVVGHTSYKKKLQPIVDKGTFNRYTFNQKGLLIELTETFKLSQQTNDSSTTQYLYENNLLEEKITSNAQGEHVYTYELNGTQKVDKLSYKRGGKGEEKMLVFEEFYTYENPNDTTEIKWFLNRYGKPYQKETYIYNSHNYLLKKEKKLVFGGKTTLLSYDYDDFGRLISLVEDKNKTVLKTNYKYDKYGNLIETDYYKNDVLTKHEEFVYDSKTALIKAHLSKEIESGTITITKFKVEFF